MVCKICKQLMAAYELAVVRYANAARNLKGLPGSDFQVASAKADGLRQDCTAASESLAAHRREVHGDTNA